MGSNAAGAKNEERLIYGGGGSQSREARGVSQERVDSSPAPSLQWLTVERLLELVAHDLNNLCHGAMSYLELAIDPKSPAVSRAKFAAQAKDLVRRASLFTPTVRLLHELRTADLSSPSEPLERALDAARAKVLDRHPGATLEVTKSGEGWAARARGGKWVTQAFLQVLDNAVHFSPDGLSGKVRAEASREDAMLKVVLRDEGRGLTPGQEAYAMRRFAEVGKVSGGGLGLAIVRIVAERAGGTAEASHAQNPRGAVITIRLPESR